MSAEQDKILQDLFIANPQKAICECQEMILKVTNFDSYDEFTSYYHNNSHTCACTKAFDQNKISIHCFDCAKCSNSYMCLNCFLNGNHENHHYIINKSPILKCDCGDITRMKSSCFCNEHKETMQYNLDQDLKAVLKDIVLKEAFLALFTMAHDEAPNISIIHDFISSFLTLGGNFCHLIVELLTNDIDFENIILHVFDYSIAFNESLSKICKFLLYDINFIQFFSNISYKLVLNHFFLISIEPQTNEDIVKKFNIWSSIVFYSFYEYPIKYNINEKKIEWIDYFINLCKQFKDVLRFVTDVKGNVSDTIFPKKALSSIIYASSTQPNEQTQLFFDRLFSEVLNCGTKNSVTNNTIISASFKDDGSKINYKPVHILCNNVYKHLFNCFKFKKNLKFDVLFEQLNSIDISPVFLPKNENDKLISKYINDNCLNTEKQEFPSYYYESFPSGGSFFICFPLYDSFITIFGLENNCRVKIAQLLLSEKYQNLRVKLGIITLQKILSFVCIDHPLIPKKNESLFTVINLYNNNNQITHNISRYIPAFQLLLGLQSNNIKEDFQLKEFFEYELARKLGIFDNYTEQNNNEQNIKDEVISEQSNKMIFSFLYLSILFVVDRILFNFNNKEFLRQQILFGIKSGINDINKLSNAFDTSILDDEQNSSIFDNVIKEINSNNNNIYNNISAVIPIMKQYVLLLKEISNNPNNLINIQEFEPEETYFFNDKLFSLSTLSTITSDLNGYDKENCLGDHEGLTIKLKELLMTPTVLAIVYHTLRMNSSNDDINIHLAINILILISKFIESEKEHEIKSKQNKIDEKIIQYESINELISTFKKDLFGYQIDDQENVYIQNIMNKDNYKSFLHLKIIFKDQEEKSITDLLMEKQKIGIDALKIIGIKQDDEINSNDKKDDDVNILNSRKSKKNEILNQFQAALNNFKVDENEEEDSDEHSCSICDLKKNDEILVYPIYVYKTKLPCIFDKPPELTGISDSVSISCDDDIYQKDPVFFKTVLSDNMEKQLAKEILRLNLLNILCQNGMYNSVIEKSQQTKEFLKKEKILREEQRKKDLHNNVPKRYIAGANYILQYSICPHLLHKMCVKTINDYKCPIDTNQRNCFLPCLTNLPKLTTSLNSDSLPSKVKNSIIDFIELMKNQIVESVFQKVDIFIELIKSMSGIITTYEVCTRSTSNNKFLDEMKILTRNLFMATWYAYRIYGKPKMMNIIPYFMENRNEKPEYNVESRLTLFQIFIKKLIESDEIEIEQKKESSFNNILELFVKSFEIKTKRNLKELLLFLRRAFLTNYFLLGNNDKYIEDITKESFKWDDVLSFSFLTGKYNIEIKDLNNDKNEIINVKPFKITNLPKEFLKFAVKPFNYPIDDISKPVYYKILDFNLMIDFYDELEEDIHENDIEKQKIIIFKNEIEKDFACHHKNYPSILLALTQNSSQLQTFYDGIIFTHPNIYYDANNFQDVNFEKKKPLFLNQNILDAIVDRILSIDMFNFEIK